MFVSLFDLFKVGIGPSSSHTVGPMVAARRFLEEVSATHDLAGVARIRASVYGSLALTGLGHGTDKAIVLGLSGARPETVDPEVANRIVEQVAARGVLAIAGGGSIPFDPKADLVFKRRERLPFHSNGMRFEALDSTGAPLAEAVYYSIGGGFVLCEAQIEATRAKAGAAPDAVPYPFASARELLALAREHDLSIAQIVRANECTRRPESELLEGIDRLWDVMQACIDRGSRAEGLLPGRLKVERRAGRMFQRLGERGRDPADPMIVMDRVNLWAIAVNEENAAGGRVVTAPTNGAAGIIPAVLRYYQDCCSGAERRGIHDFFLAATAVGALYKNNASISGAEVGCQGEVGVACSMAAAGLTAAVGGTNEQVETAAEIAMEHNLGLTCDPIGGLVQIPCIERNAIGAVKAIDASRMAMLGDGVHKVSLDKVIATMRRTGADMKTKYKETARGGLAVNETEC